MSTTTNTRAEADVDVLAFDLLKELVAITTDRWINPARVSALAQTWVPENLGAQVRFLTQLKDLVRLLPVQVFPDLDSRQAALVAVQQALDQLIDQEESQASRDRHP